MSRHCVFFDPIHIRMLFKQHVMNVFFLQKNRAMRRAHQIPDFEIIENHPFLFILPIKHKGIEIIDWFAGIWNNESNKSRLNKMKWRGKNAQPKYTVSISPLMRKEIERDREKEGDLRRAYTIYSSWLLGLCCVGTISVNNTPAMIIKIILSIRQDGERILRLFALIKIDYLLLTCLISSLLIKWFGSKSRMLLLYFKTCAWVLPLNTNIKQSIFFFSPFIAPFDQLPAITSHFVAYAQYAAVHSRVEHHPVIR